MNKYYNPRLLNTVVAGSGMEHPRRPHVIIGDKKNGFVLGDLMDANAIEEMVDSKVGDSTGLIKDIQDKLDQKQNKLTFSEIFLFNGTRLGLKQLIIESIIDARNSKPDSYVGSNLIKLNDKIKNYYTKTESDDKYQPKGNYLTSHQDISNLATKDELNNKISAKTKTFEETVTDSELNIDAGIYYTCGVIENLTIRFNEPSDHKLAEYRFEFKCPTDKATVLNLPSSVKWHNDEPLVIKPNKTYLVSIVNNIATYRFVSN